MDTVAVRNNKGKISKYEIIIVDDGSEVPITIPDNINYNIKLLRVDNNNRWTQNIARNEAAKIAKGEYFLMTDIDKIFTHSGIKECRNFTGDRLNFIRAKGWIDKNYNLQYGESFLNLINLR